MLDGIKKIIPLRLKQVLRDRILGSRAEFLLGWAINHTEEETSRPSSKVRQCIKMWPIELCECDMHIGEFKRERQYKKIIKILSDYEVNYVTDVFDENSHLAVSIDDFPKVSILLSDSGFILENRMSTVSKNQYDFPVLRDGRDVGEQVPQNAPELKALPNYFCASRKADARTMSVTISTFNDMGDIRCFHSSAARVRARKIKNISAEYRSSHRDIDVVITTVDGSDPEWRARFDEFMVSCNSDTGLARTKNNARYVNHDELRYVLRSIYYYAPYVRKIFLVTDRQCPDWLDTEDSSIELVDHTDIIDKKYLPTFNSDAIESCLWKIPDLSEKFLYFNDDVLLMGPTNREVFFTHNGLPRFFPSPRSLPDIPLDWAKSYTTHAHIQTALAFEKKGLARPSKKFKHAPFSCTKSILREIESEFERELHASRNSHVRSEESYATISFLYPNYALATGRAVYSNLKYSYVDLAWVDWLPRLKKILGRTDIAVACINESDDALGAESLDASLKGILNARFPAVPPWEKSSGAL